MVTVTLTIDYLASARLGQWVTFEPRFVKAGQSICFADCFVHADGDSCAKASATFKVARPAD